MLLPIRRHAHRSEEFSANFQASSTTVANYEDRSTLLKFDAFTGKQLGCNSAAIILD